ncbi:MAG: hypothetical protein FWE09_06925, partial [Treponema sp.]|nr:hypothetical protein [Treponema sp.]
DEGHPSRFRDLAGRYRVFASQAVSSVERPHARIGSGSALFHGGARPAAGAFQSQALAGPLVIEPQSPAALFAPKKSIGDFSLEFWLHPFAVENGEQILQWVSARPSGPLQASAGADFLFQRILVTAAMGRLNWSFHNFFSAPDRSRSMDLSFSGTTPLVPRAWSHHLIRFDSRTGMLEYLVNGKTEAIVYATSTGRERGEVYTPVTGENGSFVLGGNFAGMIDEFVIHGDRSGAAATRRYQLGGGRIETVAIDLGAGRNQALRIEAQGGRTSARNPRASNELARSGDFRFSDDSQMQFFIRASDNPFVWDSPWLPVTPGASIAAGSVVGRYVQLAVDFYPSADGESSPFLEELRVVYLRDEPPLPPSNLVAVALDGAVQLTWRNSPNQSTRGYLIFFGTADNEFFGAVSAYGPSPIDVGMRNSVVIDGLENGALYFFRVAAYSYMLPTHMLSGNLAPHVGDFSNEARARPLQGR